MHILRFLSKLYYASATYLVDLCVCGFRWCIILSTLWFIVCSVFFFRISLQCAWKRWSDIYVTVPMKILAYFAERNVLRYFPVSNALCESTKFSCRSFSYHQFRRLFANKRKFYIFYYRNSTHRHFFLDLFYFTAKNTGWKLFYHNIAYIYLRCCCFGHRVLLY